MKENSKLLIYVVVILVFCVSGNVFAYTELTKSGERFSNGKYVWNVVNDGDTVGEFWPISGINLVTKQTNPKLFTSEMTLNKLQEKLGGVATAPDGMTSANHGVFALEGKSLANGKTCGDGTVPNFGIIVVNDGFDITFTHKQEVHDFNTFYESHKKLENTLFFLPSIYRNGKYLNSDSGIDKVLIRRSVPDGVQEGVIIFDYIVTYNTATSIVLGLDRKNKSKTTHIYVLDGGPNWGQSAKEVNGEVKLVGTRKPEYVTNYLVFY